ncbi:UNVERIFIED_CONTAM: hypothetical protein HDU68_007284 [Siphonaria sp. JEL0065]|nr:hypothetical protein HDU68_007284 [Siphonaria sp. JEL0065]
MANEIDAYVSGLESQLAELKAIIYGRPLRCHCQVPNVMLVGATDTAPPGNAAGSSESASKDKEIEALKAENKKLQYRIMTLVRTVGEKRAIINELERK